MAGTSVYPAQLDNWTTDPGANTPMNTPGVQHHMLHTQHQDALEAIEGELGTNPSASYATVGARIAGAESAASSASSAASAASSAAAAATVAVAGKADISHVHDASNITSGVLAQARVPSITIALLPSHSFIYVDKIKDGGWIPRPSNRTDITCYWIGDTDPTLTSGTGVLAGDLWRQP